MVGQQPLELFILVRIQVPQQSARSIDETERPQKIAKKAF